MNRRSPACCCALLVLGFSWASSVAQAETPTAGVDPVEGLASYLNVPAERRPSLAGQEFAATPLTKSQAQRATALLQRDHVRRIRAERGAEMKARRITLDGKTMPFHYTVFGDAPVGGRSLYISLHGGGGAPAAVNERQWHNQKRLYQPAEGVYLAPRAPSDTWDLWHQGHVDPLLRRLIENLIVFEQVNPDRVYLLGYSAGGDGVYQLAPRMADSLAAASMMAGHPNETSPLGLRNLPFSLHVGARDGAYNRNGVAEKWATHLDTLAKADPGGYVHWAKIYAGKGHWLDGEDAAALPWMAKYTRTRYPERVVWKQDDVRHTRFYWLGAADAHHGARHEVVVVRRGQRFDVERSQAPALTFLLSDDFVDLDQPVTVWHGGKPRFDGKLTRTIATLARSLAERGDPGMMYAAALTVVLEVPGPE